MILGRIFRLSSTLGYALCLLWYAYDAWLAYAAAHSRQNYPFMLTMDNLPVALFSIAGGVFWFTFGMDRSGAPASILGYATAGAHVLVFAFQVWLGPMIWVLNNVSQ